MDSKLENRIDEIFKDVPKTEKMVLTISKLKEKANSKFIEIREQGFSRTVAYNEVDDWIMKAKIIIDEEVAKLNETEQAPLKKTSPSTKNASVMTEPVNVKVNDKPAIIVENIDTPVENGDIVPEPELKVAKAPVAPKAVSYDNLKVASADVVTLPPQPIKDDTKIPKAETAIKEQKAEKSKVEESVQKPKTEKPKKVSADVSDFDLDDILGKPKKKKEKPEKAVKAKEEKIEKVKKAKPEKAEKIKKEKPEKVKKEKIEKIESAVLPVETEKMEAEDTIVLETQQADLEVKDFSAPEIEQATEITEPETKQAELKDFSVHKQEEAVIPEYEYNAENLTADSNFESIVSEYNNNNTETEQFKGNKILGITYFVLGGAVAVVSILTLLGVF